MWVDPLIGARTTHFAATILFAGTVFFRFLIAAPALRHAHSSSGVAEAALSALTWLAFAVVVVSGAAWFVLQAAAMSGHSIGASWSEGVLGLALADTRFGRVLVLRAGCAILFVLVLLSRGAENIA